MTNAILLDKKDNVATCTAAAKKGDMIKILGGAEIVCIENIPATGEPTDARAFAITF